MSKKVTTGPIGRLTNEDIVDIFRMKNVERVSAREIGEQYGVSDTFIYRILDRRNYARVIIPDKLLRKASLKTEYGGRFSAKAVRFYNKNKGWHISDVAEKFGMRVEDLSRELTLLGKRVSFVSVDTPDDVILPRGINA